MSARLRLRRGDGRVYLDRWGVEFPSKVTDAEGRQLRAPWFGVFVHRFSAPDPGVEVHDHPWWFGSLVLKGAYSEERVDARDACNEATFADEMERSSREPVGWYPRGVRVRRGWLSWRSMRLDEAHRIVALERPAVWTLVVHGPTRRQWGFYLPAGWMNWRRYDASVRAERRDLVAEISNDERGAR